MSKLSGIRDVDREILSKLDDASLLKACSVNKYTWNTVCDDAFLKRRLLAKYPNIENEKWANESWKRFFLRATHYIALLKEKFGYDYTFGNFVKQKIILENYKINDNILIESASKGELALVIWSLKNGADIHNNLEAALRHASEFGHLEVVKYLVKQGADIHALHDNALIWASGNGHLSVVKYLVEKGAIVNAEEESPLINAIFRERFEIVKYLIESGANFRAKNDKALIVASENGNLRIVKYLVERGADVRAQNNEALKLAEYYEFNNVVNYLKSRM